MTILCSSYLILVRLVESWGLIEDRRPLNLRVSDATMDHEFLIICLRYLTIHLLWLIELSAMILTTKCILNIYATVSLFSLTNTNLTDSESQKRKFWIIEVLWFMHQKHTETHADAWSCKQEMGTVQGAGRYRTWA